MKKKVYQTPTMQVIKLQHQTHLLQASGVQSIRSGYGTAQEQTWSDEEE